MPVHEENGPPGAACGQTERRAESGGSGPHDHDVVCIHAVVYYTIDRGPVHTPVRDDADGPLRSRSACYDSGGGKPGAPVCPEGASW